jgi:short-subunit dehydrogenase
MPSTPRVAIFGATSDIAAATARRYGERQARLVLVGRNLEALDSMAADLKVRGASEVAAVRADFDEIEALPNLVETVWAMFSGLDIALIAYGSLPDQKAAERDQRNAAEALKLNLLSPALLANGLASRFEAQGAGTIAVITSVAGDRGRQSNYIYGAAKGGLQRFLEGLRHRLSKSSVEVLDVRPGFVATKMTAHLSQAGLLWAPPTKVADDIVRAIDRRRQVLYTPWFWRGIMGIVRATPSILFHRSSL